MVLLHTKKDFEQHSNYSHEMNSKSNLVEPINRLEKKWLFSNSCNFKNKWVLLTKSCHVIVSRLHIIIPKRLSCTHWFVLTV